MAPPVALLAPLVALSVALSAALLVPLHATAAMAPPADNDDQHDAPGWMDRFLDKLGASQQVDLSHGIDWGVLPGPFYNPEMGLGIGMAAVGLYKPDHAAPDTQLSTLTLRGFATTTGALGIGMENNTFFGDDRYRFVMSGALVNMPTSYWGVGEARASDDANKEGYTRREIMLQPRVMARVRPNTYVGAGLFLQYDNAVDPDRGASSQLVTNPHGSRVFSAGLSAHLSYDTRDFLPNPYVGQALMVNGTLFRRAFGSDTDFETLELTYDRYFRLRDQDVLAFDVYGKFNWGDVPWNMMSTLGDGKRMRGYFLGQYRDKAMLAAQVEYRRHLVGRHGMVFWLGTGAIAASPGALTSATWLPNVGIGYRFAFKPRVNVRVDAGFGKDTKGIYFQINEAF